MLKRKSVALLALTALAAIAAARAEATSIVLNPNGPIEVQSGHTNGWGYTIVNDDAAGRDIDFNWVVAAELAVFPAGSSVSAFPFDFPEVPNGTSLSLAYDGVFGLVEVFAPGTALEGDVISGHVYGTYRLVNPLDDADFEDVAFDVPFSATVVPGPTSLALWGATLVLMAAARRRRRD